ncbi:MAG: GTPase ObgE, partial [Candidatus Limnocylindrales bacterium]
MFLDRVTIFVRAGDGGDGAATFRREAHVPRGGPDGGDGGRGGSIYLQVDAGQTTLGDYRFRHHFRAAAGGPGRGAKRHGKAGHDLELTVPPGTAVYDASSGDLLADLVARRQRLLVARGGRGGLGNVHFATATHRTPKHAQKGEPGEERWLRLELRLIADVGLVGLPNAGKSTVLAALTAATPKIAAYPFTTLEPNLGVLDLEALDPADTRRPTIADVPGLIEGASSGAGLGHAFLRHVERTRLLAHVVDLGASSAERDFAAIREELRLHDPALLEKPTLVIANKL